MIITSDRLREIGYEAEEAVGRFCFKKGNGSSYQIRSRKVITCLTCNESHSPYAYSTYSTIAEIHEGHKIDIS